jgi:hypothetical protein
MLFSCRSQRTGWRGFYFTGQLQPKSYGRPRCWRLFFVKYATSKKANTWIFRPPGNPPATFTGCEPGHPFPGGCCVIAARSLRPGSRVCRVLRSLCEGVVDDTKAQPLPEPMGGRCELHHPRWGALHVMASARQRGNGEPWIAHNHPWRDGPFHLLAGWRSVQVRNRNNARPGSALRNVDEAE